MRPVLIITGFVFVCVCACVLHDYLSQRLSVWLDICVCVYVKFDLSPSPSLEHLFLLYQAAQLGLVQVLLEKWHTVWFAVQTVGSCLSLRVSLYFFSC